MIRRFFSYVYVLSNIHKHLCTGCMLHEHVQGKPCNELFLLSHSHTCESLFKHLVPEDCRTRFCVRQIDSEDTVANPKSNLLLCLSVGRKPPITKSLFPNSCKKKFSKSNQLHPVPHFIIPQSNARYVLCTVLILALQVGCRK